MGKTFQLLLDSFWYIWLDCYHLKSDKLADGTLKSRVDIWHLWFPPAPVPCGLLSSWLSYIKSEVFFAFIEVVSWNYLLPLEDHRATRYMCVCVGGGSTLAICKWKHEGRWVCGVACAVELVQIPSDLSCSTHRTHDHLSYRPRDDFYGICGSYAPAAAIERVLSGG